MRRSVFQVVDGARLPRAEQVARLAELGFTWANLEEEPYWLEQIAVMDRKVYEELEQASAQLWKLLDQTVRYIHRRPDLYELIGIPPILWEMLDLSELPEESKLSCYARFDFAISQTGDIKLLEVNADTPTGYVEAAIATPWLCEQAGIASPNGGMKERLREAWAVERPEVAACVGYGSHQEDSGTIEALVRHSGLEMRCVDCLELSIDEGIVKDGQGRPIHRMFALYPKEWMAVDDGGDALAYSIETGKLKLFNPPLAILLQSKGLLAAVWGMYELGLLYDEAARGVIERYVLPAYTKPVFEGSFVSKSMFGREGGSVRMFDEAGQLELEDQDGFDTSILFPTVYQKRAELAQVETKAGSLHLLTGMFIIDGAPCGLLGRAGGPITGNTSHFIPIGVNESAD